MSKLKIHINIQTLARPRHVRDHNNVMIKVMTSVEIKAMNIVVMFQGQVFCLTNEGSLVTANLLTEVLLNPLFRIQSEFKC
jgi:hypothetical protein